MKTVLITGANGEIGHALINELSDDQNTRIIATDIVELEQTLRSKCYEFRLADLSEQTLSDSLLSEDIDVVFHLGALLSTSGERNPELAHKVNVGGTISLLSMTQKIGKRRGMAPVFFFPSTIAVYGHSSLEEKNSVQSVSEDFFLNPITMYGANKLYCEHLGRYYSDYYKLISPEKEQGFVDFRALRFPGLISTETLPSGGTSDFAPEMIHSAIAGRPYQCFVRADSKIPFMTMNDAIRGIMELTNSNREKLSRRVYNIGAFAMSAQEIADEVRSAISDVPITFVPNPARQKVVDSWCAEVNFERATRDWGWKPAHQFDDLVTMLTKSK